jgi:pyruvate dehydrogenase E2 component (dihydrolipoamide acetyltransferase)
VDLSQVRGTGAGGRITREDVKAHVQGALETEPASGRPPAPSDLPDFAKWGEIERQPLRSVRRKIAENLVAAWTQVPHVTQFDAADATDLEAFRQRHKTEAESWGGRLTPTVLLLKAVVNALKAFPQFNASLDAAAGELVLKRYYHIGIAVDTERGLLVPVIRDVDRKDIFELAVELNEMAERTRTGKVDLQELQGGSFTVTNLGSISGTAFTPIVNHPEVAILGIAQSRQEPVIRDGRVEPRLMMPLCLSYDHRVIDGADGARFTKHLVESLENPERMLLGG